MICHICKSKVHSAYKVIKGVEIFECAKCEMGFIDQNGKATPLVRSNKNCKILYDFEGYKKEEKKLRRRFDWLIKKIVKIKKKGKILDVGAGFGLFSSMLYEYGDFKQDILEPAIKPFYAKREKIKIFKDTFEQFMKKRNNYHTTVRGSYLGRYDMVVLLDVIEHFSDPFWVLDSVKRLLDNRGILVIQTPNYKSLMASLCRDWAWWMIEDHKFFFSPKSIKLALDKAGYEIIHFRTYEDFEDFKKNLDGNFVGIRNNILRKILKAIFYSIFAPFYFLSRKILWRLGYGGLLFLIAR